MQLEKRQKREKLPVTGAIQGKVYKVRANHYPANVTVEMDHLEHPIGIFVFKDILYCAESKRNAISFKDLTGDTIVDVDKLTVEKLKGKLKDIGAWNEDCKKKPKKYLQEKLRSIRRQSCFRSKPGAREGTRQNPSFEYSL